MSQEILILLLSGGGVVVALISILPKLVELYYKYRKKTFKDELIKVAKLFDIMKQLIEQSSNIDRILILKTTNGGGRPKLGNKIYATALYQEVREPLKITKESYQKLLVDSHYVKMLAKSEASHGVRLLVRDMPYDSLLKNIYEVEGITYSEIYHLQNTKNSFYFMSISTHGGSNFDSKETRLAINLGVNAIRNIMAQVK